MAAILRMDSNESLTYANAPRVEREGKTYLEDAAALELMMRIAVEEKDLLDALAAQ